MSSAKFQATLDQWTDFVSDLSSPQFFIQVAAETAEDSQELISGTFERQSTPDGVPWKRRKDNKPHRILDETGTLKDFKILDVSEDGHTVGTFADYASYHQEGTRFVDSREFLPDGNLPVSWSNRYTGTVERIIVDKVRQLGLS